MNYVELQVTSNFTFLRGGSHPEELIETAAALGHKAIALTDRNTLAGIVRAHIAAKNKNIRFIPACRLDLLDGPSLLAFPENKAAYNNLSSLLTKGNLRAEKGSCHLYKSDVYDHAEGITFIALPPATLNNDFDFDETYLHALKEYKESFGTKLYIGAAFLYSGDDQKKLYRLCQLEDKLNIPLAALNDIHYHNPERRQLQDILTCVREKCTIQSAGLKLHANAERYLKAPKEMYRIFRQYPHALANSLAIADACKFSLEELEYIYPEEIVSENRSPMEELTMLTWKGAHEHFGDSIPDTLRSTLELELAFINKKNYASYFLTVYDLVRFARERGILCQGRGSAANSAVCYCLGITAVNPTKFKLLFARFMSEARDEPPDIDVDFEHERREEVIQYIYTKYGRHRAGIVATVTQVHWKGAVRDVGKAMGLSVDVLDKLSKSAYEFTDDWFSTKGSTTDGFDANDLHLKKTLELTNTYIGFPRQLGQHTGGFVITQNNLWDLCPIINARMEDRTNIEWNKDDIEALGFLKIDVLALGMLTCIRKGFELAKKHYDLDLTLANINQDDSNVYQMISLADTLGVFQIESRAQMSMLPRLRPKDFYDLVIQVAIVRPGPIQGDMVHPYLKRRNNEELVEYPSKELEEILKRTLGVPLFQEQAMEIAIVAAGFTPAQADGLRRSMATFKAKGKVAEYKRMLIQGMIKNGYEEDFSHRIYRQLEGFGSYGFPESHAASFALLVYISSWIKCYYPDIFACSLLNSQPMGFYSAAQIVIDARKHGIQVRPVDINHSHWDNTLEEKSGTHHVLRLGFRQVKSLQQQEVSHLLKGRTKPYKTINELFRSGISITAIERLADADAFGSIGLDRRQALWEVSALKDNPIGLFTEQPSDSAFEHQVTLPPISAMEHVIQDYANTSLSLKAHPVSFARERLHKLHVTPAAQLSSLKNGDLVKVCGLVTVRQRPSTAKGVLFITIEDETGFSNLVVWEKTFSIYRKIILQAHLLMVVGKLQIENNVIHIIAQSCHNMNQLLQLEAIESTSSSQDKSSQKVTGNLQINPSKGIQIELFPSRDFK